MDFERLVGQLLRYGATGASGLAINVVVLMALIEIIKLPKTDSAIISAGVTLGVTFVMSERWVFQAYVADDVRTVVSRIPVYYVVMIAGKTVNFGIYVILLGIGVWYPLAWIIGSVLVFALTFLANRFAWKRTTRKQGAL